jgi:hypothetical protein
VPPEAVEQQMVRSHSSRCPILILTVFEVHYQRYKHMMLSQACSLCGCSCKSWV